MSTEGGTPNYHRSLKDYLFLILERLWIVIIGLICGLVYGAYQTTLIVPKYVSTATIQVDREMKEVAGEMADSEKLRLGLFKIETVLEKLRLPSLHREVAALPEFVGPEKSPEAEKRRQLLAAQMGGWLKMTNNPRTTLIYIECTHPDAEMAYKVIVGLLDRYAFLNYTARSENSQTNLAHLTEESRRIKESMLEAEQSLLVYKQVAEMAKAIRETRTEILEMEKIYLPKWPALIEAKEHLRLQEVAFLKELQRIETTSAVEREFWQSHAEQIAKLPAEEVVNYRLQTAEARSNLLQREFESESKLYESMIAQMKRGDIMKGLAKKEFSIVQPPEKASVPIVQSKAKPYVRYGLVGLGGGIFLALFLGLLDSSIKRIEDLERFTGLPVLASVPDSGDLKGKEKGKQGIVMFENSETPVAESFRTLRAFLCLLGPQEERKVFLISSACPQEGKSSISANLAAAFSQQGDKTLLIDFDLRRPRIHQFFEGSKESKGIVDFLVGQVEFQDAILKGVSENLDVMTSGTPAPNPGELLATKNVDVLLEEARKHYDRVIIDSAPITAVSDTLHLAKKIPSLCLVFRLWKTSRTALKRALKILKENQTTPSAIVANFSGKKGVVGKTEYYHSYSGGSSYYYANR